MKLAVICLFSIVLCLAAEFSSAQNYRLGRNTNVNSRGINHRSNNGRHNTNINYRSARYNYRGNQWNTNVHHNYRSRQTNLDANYRRNHNFRAGHNWQNRQTNLGYRWNFGKRRRSIDSQDEMLQFLQMENEPTVFVAKLRLAVDSFVKTYRDAVPELEILSFPGTDDSQITNSTAARETVCVVRKLQALLPNTLGNFIVKMIKYHGDDFDIENLQDFFSIENEDPCEVPEVPASPEFVESGKLYEMKKFVATLITVAMEYQQTLE